jgi:hypothetical protein
MTTEGAIRFGVRDEGAGMARRTFRVFERFLPRAAGHSKTEGLGLGLALAKAIVDAHEGRIEVEAARVGHPFRITLPRHDGILTPRGHPGRRRVEDFIDFNEGSCTLSRWVVPERPQVRRGTRSKRPEVRMKNSRNI